MSSELNRLSAASKKSGKAILVGAGSGHPGLITIRGRERLRAADVILYDRIIARELLSEVRPDAELVFVGKRPGHHPKPQPEINRLLLEYVGQGKNVVRLKGGDPFVFSRGGEEILALKAAGFPFEVVPGVTSAMAAPAFAGIPITQKGINTSFTVLTGHEAPDKPETMIDWQSLAYQETLVMLMAVKKLNYVCSSLIAAGKAASTPAAMISWGCTDHQQTLVGSLETLPQLFESNPLPTPAIIVVGAVVGLNSKLKWHHPRGQAAGFIGKDRHIKKSSLPNPTVALVGAGPGAADLITVRGLELLQQADIVLHDRLVNPALLKRCQSAAEIINVGKSPERDRYPQSEINRILVEKAATDKKIVRLKGGDPFIFGLGGDECLALSEAGITYEIVPGLSSVTAVPAHAGIPLTQRGTNASFTVISGHLPPGHPDAPHWDKLPIQTTLVILMGNKKLYQIAKYLINSGRSADTPVAVIESGTTAAQKVFIGTLATIADISTARPPAMIIIGDVVALRDQMSWFDPAELDQESQKFESWGQAVDWQPATAQIENLLQNQTK